MRRSKWLAILSLAAAAAWAQQQEPFEDNEGGAPDHHAARIAALQGNVTIQRADSGDTVAAGVNHAVLGGDRVVVGEGRVEVQLDSANLVRLGASSEMRVADLQYKHYELQLASGTLTYRMVRDSDTVADVNTPLVSLRPTQRGVYRINVRPDGSGEFTVWSGALDVYSSRGSQVLRSGSTMLVRGTSADPEYQVVNAGAEDAFDRWSTSRDRDLDRTISTRYVNPDVYGVDELDTYGRWQYEAPYGYVWVPTVATDWAPYRYGSWYWADYYGWTWYSGDPWGWAPYHYGRWYRGRWGWSWYPGGLVGRYYWRPALVSFVGWGGAVGFGFGYEHVGWVPLAPYERYRPWYGRAGGFQVVNQTNIVNVYRNSTYITGVRSSEFGRGPIGRGNYVRPQGSDLTRAASFQGQLPGSQGQLPGNGTPAIRPNPGRERAENGFTRRPMQATPAPAAQSPNAAPRFGSPRAPEVSSSVGNPGGNSGGWRRMDPAENPARPRSSTWERVQPVEAPRQQPVQIRPPIVRGRPDNAPPSAPPRVAAPPPESNFGRARSSPGPSVGAPSAPPSAAPSRPAPAQRGGGERGGVERGGAERGGGDRGGSGNGGRQRGR